MMRWVLAIAAVAASAALHVGLAALFLSEQSTMELAGGEQQSAVLIMGKEEFDALAGGEPELQEQLPEETRDEQKESTPQPEVSETPDAVEETTSVPPDKQPEPVEGDTPDPKIPEPDEEVATLSEPAAEKQPRLKEPPVSTDLPTAAQSVSKTEESEVAEVQARDTQEVQDSRPEVVKEKTTKPQSVQSETVEKLLPAEQPKAVTDIPVETANPQVKLTEQTASTEQQIEKPKTSTPKPSEKNNSDSVANVDLNAADIPVPTPRPEAIANTKRKAKTKPPAQNKKITKKRLVKEKQSAKKLTKKNNNQQKQNKVQKAGAKSNSKTNAKRGSAAAKPNKSKSQGNAKASKYPGKVYAKIARTRRKQAGDSGTARVRFVIANNGRLSSVSLARRSGSKKVDKAALDHVRRAAPFPKPPAGAKRSFVIPLQFKN